MRYKFILPLVLFSLVFNNVSASGNSTLYYLSRGIKKPSPTGEPNSLNWKIINYNKSIHEVEDECEPSNELYSLLDPDSHKEQFKLSVGVGHDEISGSEKIVLNVTISNVTFHKLRIVQQSLVRPSSVLKIYETIQFGEDEKPEKLTMLLLVTEYERTRLQFFADESRNGFFKEYQFIPPSSSDIKDHGAIREDGIFSYLDTTTPEKIWLHVQPLPENWNITEYIGELRKQPAPAKKFDTLYSFNITGKYLQYVTSNFTDDGLYDFQLTPVDNNGKKYASTRVASFCKENHQSLVVMIVSITAVPVAMFFALFVVLYIKCGNILQKRLKTSQPHCLIVHAATHGPHITFVQKLVEYLNGCQITAVNLLNVPTKICPNPKMWCDDAFKKANFVIVLSSPGCNNPVSTTATPYRLLFPSAMVLIHENRSYKDKSYLTVMLPDCDESDVPDEARTFRRLKMKKAKDVKKLVNMIHNFKYTEEFKVPDTRELVNIIKSAKRNISPGELHSTPRSFERLTDFAPPSSDESDEDDSTLICPDLLNAHGNIYRTDIRDLNTTGSSTDLTDPEAILNHL